MISTIIGFMSGGTSTTIAFAFRVLVGVIKPLLTERLASEMLRKLMIYLLDRQVFNNSNGLKSVAARIVLEEMKLK